MFHAPAEGLVKKKTWPNTTLTKRCCAHTALFMWRMLCTGFRHSACFHARVILDSAACRLGDPVEVHDVLGVLGVDRVVPIVVRVLVSW